MPTAHRMPGETFAGYTQLVTLACCTCGVSFAMPEMLYDKAREDHDRWFYCPNGHNQHFLGRTAAEKLEEQLASERRRSGRLAAERDQTQARLRAQKGVTTKLRKRIANGVCPVCHRHFAGLERHIAGQHPDFAGTED